MAISPDGTTLLVSDSTANVVHALDTATGEKVGEFPSGDSPHENAYFDDGQKVLPASIGRVYTPTDREELGLVRDTSKGERVFQVVDAETFEVLQRWDIGEELAEAGHDGMSAAGRPMALAPDEQTVYFQVSFHHGFVEFDLAEGEVTRVADLPVSEEAEQMPREQYLLDSAHHGLAMNAAGDTLCAAGTMSDYAAMVDRETFEVLGTFDARGSRSCPGSPSARPAQGAGRMCRQSDSMVYNITTSHNDDGRARTARRGRQIPPTAVFRAVSEPP